MNPTKLLLATIASFVMVSSLRAEEGTLTFNGEQILFVATSGTKSYEVMPIGETVDGLKSIEYKRKLVVKGDNEVDVSELILENTADGSKLILVNKVPLKVTRTGEAEKTVWKPVEK